MIDRICSNTHLSIHDLTRRSTNLLSLHALFNPIFQFTTSQGGRPCHMQSSAHTIGLSIHDLTRRSTYIAGREKGWKRTFNSRPHKEVDGTAAQNLELLNLSIHDLTRRSTLLFHFAVTCRHFQFTTSQGGRHLYQKTTAPCLSFNSRPHKEVDAFS